MCVCVDVYEWVGKWGLYILECPSLASFLSPPSSFTSASARRRLHRRAHPLGQPRRHRHRRAQRHGGMARVGMRVRACHACTHIHARVCICKDPPPLPLLAPFLPITTPPHTCSPLGQLLVWEWQSETYVLKQQGHADSVAAVAFAPDGQVTNNVHF